MTQPTIEEIAGWLREAANKCEYGPDSKFLLWVDRAAQVEDMGFPKTCDWCKYWKREECTKSGSMSKEPPDYMSGFDCGPKFGCVHHEPITQPPVKK